MRTCDTPGEILTYTGKMFSPLNPRCEDICIEDIAHSLSNLCRFTGHTRHFYSVAQHCVRVSRLVPPEHALWGLLHDATEAYINDIALPLKMLDSYKHYREAEKHLSDCIMTAFNLPVEEPPEVKWADREACKQEGAAFMLNWKTPPEDINFAPFKIMLPGESKKIFLQRFRELW